MNVYGSMDRQALDAAYNNSAAVADSERYLADWLRRSEVLRVRRPDHLDMPATPQRIWDAIQEVRQSGATGGQVVC